MKKTISVLAVVFVILFASLSVAAAMGQSQPTTEEAKVAVEEVTIIEETTETERLYDGLWFLGFNLHKDIFDGENGLKVKKAIGLSINRDEIANKIIGGTMVPDSVIPKTMNGYQADSLDLPYDAKQAKALMIEAGFPMNDQRIKGLALLHTDGDKTIKIAKLIKQNLSAIGVKVDLVQVSFREEGKWQEALESGKFHMFLMGYKAADFGTLFIGDKKTKLFHKVDCEDMPDPKNQVFLSSYEEAIKQGFAPCKKCNPQPEPPTNTYELVEPLFHTGGSANFTFFRNIRVDNLLDQISIMDTSLVHERGEKFKEINTLLCKELPSIPLFYITKL
ncbi:MAG: hypothetical protein KKB81_00270 [Candidatus Margulisbacteria bacterium]|nr:hypothetical protein [Candidatus Margulisiibacteriota bacterium]MBU1022390.1 hypothetical protein [Candidatus Margulisiibacteriota bacterium]MBU1729058.1 hypothetical protein [Candidatus Margulisiibacteriota bacterium]MBU1954521.1 hypothetical protein [Candidatus Margulisiibacteriota bacterium]